MTPFCHFIYAFQIKEMPHASDGTPRASIPLESSRLAMIVYIMSGVLAVLAFLCVSDGIPDLTQRKGPSQRPNRPL